MVGILAVLVELVLAEDVAAADPELSHLRLGS